MTAIHATVIGGRATLRELRSVEAGLYWETIREMKSAAKPLADAIDGNYPTEPPTRGFDHKGRTGWRNRKRTDRKVGGRRKRNGEWPLLRIIVADAPRQIFDLANRGQLSVAIESNGFGSPSRGAWRTSQALRRETVQAVEQAIRDGSRKANTRLRKVR